MRLFFIIFLGFGILEPLGYMGLRFYSNLKTLWLSFPWIFFFLPPSSGYFNNTCICLYKVVLWFPHTLFT